MVRKLTLEEFSSKLPKPAEDDYYVVAIVVKGQGSKDIPGVRRHAVLRRYWSKDFLQAANEAIAVREGTEFRVGDKVIPKDLLKVMYYVNPIDFLKLSYTVVSSFIQDKLNLIMNLRGKDYESVRKQLASQDIFSVAFSKMAKATEKHVIMVDVDSKAPGVLSLLEGIPVRLVVETRRGYHLHVYKEDVKDNEAFRKLYSIGKAFSDSKNFNSTIGRVSGIPWKEKLIEVKGVNALEYVPVSGFNAFEIEGRDLREFIEYVKGGNTG
ncbi:hypothetical protein [Stygiolobus caldivivus]|uniref:hypothetical protein n=1 Tax=Stygiolobus caldivivus TaxID=2824673 RepID=UPI001C865F53|nr:hypothetical protein [Stygiolobus caldivivus]